jgi:hypothetical protein
LGAGFYGFKIRRFDADFTRICTQIPEYPQIEGAPAKG